MYFYPPARQLRSQLQHSIPAYLLHFRLGPKMVLWTGYVPWAYSKRSGIWCFILSMYRSLLGGVLDCPLFPCKVCNCTEKCFLSLQGYVRNPVNWHKLFLFCACRRSLLCLDLGCSMWPKRLFASLSPWTQFFFISIKYFNNKGYIRRPNNKHAASILFLSCLLPPCIERLGHINFRRSTFLSRLIIPKINCFSFAMNPAT